MATTRRELLRLSDQLLDAIERLRLADHEQLPEPLQQGLQQLEEKLGQAGPEENISSLAAAHSYVFDLQRWHLLQTIRPPRRAAGQPASSVAFRSLSLPSRWDSTDEEDWRELSEAMVERADDRWRLLQAEVQSEVEQSQTVPAAREAAVRAARVNRDELITDFQATFGETPRLRRMPDLPSIGTLTVARWRISLADGIARSGARSVYLTPIEAACLAALAMACGRLLSREGLALATGAGRRWSVVRTRAVDVHISHLRAKLGGDILIETVPGIGYRLAAASS